MGILSLITLQIAAHEAKPGHINLADEIKKIIDKAKQFRPKLQTINNDLQGLLIEAKPICRLSDLILPDKIIERIKRIEKEFIERDESGSIILAATNNLALLDQALFRRFDDVIHYQLPDDTEKARLIENKIGNYIGNFNIIDIVSKIGNLSHSEITQACNDAVKEAILSNKNKIEEEELMKMIEEQR